MPELMDQVTRDKLSELLATMEQPVRLVLLTDDSPVSKLQQEVLEAVAALSGKITLQALPARKHKKEAGRYGVDKFPATVPLGPEDYGIRFYGLTAGHEFASFVQTLMMLSLGASGLAPEIEAVVRTIDQPVDIQVFVTTACPYCPAMVHAAHQFAFVNEHIRADMIEASQFIELARRYQVEGVPRTVINETTVLEGAHPEAILYLNVLRAVDPEAYRRVEAELRERQGSRHVAPLAEDHRYDLLIVGGGPAALSAALYAARKRLDVGLLADKIGGQMTYTAKVENYLGFPGIAGNELVERFQAHVESYPIAELTDVQVAVVRPEAEGFRLETADGRAFRARAVVYCAGNEYRRLGVPGEERFLGNGVAFCATCDAPLYQGRKAAVVGGGNSALTAVRDLLSYADEVHLIHRRERFTADAALLEEVRAHPKVHVHAPYRVRAYLGEERLRGVEIEPAAGGPLTPEESPNADAAPNDRYAGKTSDTNGGPAEELAVDGVFLEIGLAPNSGPVRELLALNDKGEIPIGADHATAREGFFAAGDVTDVPEKQISIAVGAGALAALSAYRYLVEKRLFTPQTRVEEW